MKVVVFLFLGFSSFWTSVQADSWGRQSQLQQFPFQMELDMERVYELTHVQPNKLVALIKSWGIEIYVVGGDKPAIQKQSYLTNLPPASEAQKLSAQWQPSYVGRALSSKLNLGFNVPTILIREEAHPQVLMHETLHLLLKYSAQAPRDGIDDIYNRYSRRLDFFQRKLIDNPVNLLNPLWRRDILNAKTELMSLLYERVQFGQAQEAIIELVLAKYIDQKSPYYDAKRLKEGIKYAEQSINNAISVYNHLDFLLNVNNRTVQDLYDSLERKELILMDPSRESLTQANVDDFGEVTAHLMSVLMPVKDQILGLRQNYIVTVAELGIGADSGITAHR